MRRLLLCQFVFVASVSAQEVTGSLEGRVITENNGAIEGAQIIAQGTALQGIRSAMTDARGRFAFLALPAGSYTVTVKRIGFSSVRAQDVFVRLGSTTSLGDIRLDARAVEVAEVVVSAAKPVIDPVSPAPGVALDSSQFLSLPTARDFRALIPFVPQANASVYDGDGVNIGGATGLENAFYVDGMNVTVDAGATMNVPFNFVREIQVSTGGYGAEYGRALSSVINVVTPSGGNEFHGQGFGFFTNDALRSAPRVGVGEAFPVTFNQYDIGLSLSGPIRRDRLWYFAAYNPTFVNRDVSLAALPTQRDAQVHHLLAAKLSWSIGAQTDAVVTFLGDPSRRDGVGMTRLPDPLPSTTDPGTALVREIGGGSSIAAEVHHNIDPRTQLTIAVSELRRREEFGPPGGSTSLADLSRIDDYATNASRGGLGIFDNVHQSRTAVRTTLTFLRNAHALKFGVEYEQDEASDNSAVSNVLRYADSVYDWFELSFSSHVHNHIPTMFAQDAWEANRRLRVSVGWRWEAQYMSGAVGPSRTIIEFAPRLGAVYELGELGTQRVLVNAGRFFEQVMPPALTVWNGSTTQLAREYTQNPLVDSSNSKVLSRLDLPMGVPATSNLIGQYYDQVTLGYERSLGTAFKIGAHGTYRILRWALEDGVAPGASEYRMGNPGRGPLATMPRARQRYAALELSLERSTPGPLYLLASYVLSRNVGNYTGLYATDLMAALPNAGPQYDFPDLMINAYGPLPNDRTHVVKVATSYHFRFGAALGGFLTVASGTPLSEYGASAYGPPYLTFVRARGSAGRTPTVWSLDLHGAYEFSIAHRGRLRPRFLLDVFSLGSPRTALLYDQRHYLDNARTQVNPNYGAITRHEPPMSARLGLAVDF